MVWEIDKVWFNSISMNMHSMVVLNYLDKQSYFIDKLGNMYQYYHGNVKTTGNKLGVLA